MPEVYLQVPDDDDQRRRYQSSHEGERWTEDDHPDRDGHQPHEIGHQDGDARREHGVQRLDVGRAAADDIAHGCPVEVADRQPLKMGKEAYPNPVEHSLRDGRGEIAVEKRHRLDCGVGPEIQDGEEEQASRSPRRQMVVDDGPDDEWRHELEGSGGEHEQHDDAGSDAPGPQQACQMAGQRSGFAGVAGIDEDKATHSRAASVDAISALSCAR